MSWLSFMAIEIRRTGSHVSTRKNVGEAQSRMTRILTTGKTSGGWNTRIG